MMENKDKQKSKKLDEKWHKMYIDLKTHYETLEYDPFKRLPIELYNWERYQNQINNKGKLSDARVYKLNQIGFKWDENVAPLKSKEEKAKSSASNDGISNDKQTIKCLTEENSLYKKKIADLEFSIKELKEINEKQSMELEQLKEKYESLLERTNNNNSSKEYHLHKKKSPINVQINSKKQSNFHHKPRTKIVNKKKRTPSSSYNTRGKNKKHKSIIANQEMGEILKNNSLTIAKSTLLSEDVSTGTVMINFDSKIHESIYKFFFVLTGIIQRGRYHIKFQFKTQTPLSLK